MGGLVARLKASSAASALATAAPSTEELRERTREFLISAGRGWQGRLAHSASIPAGTFSKFLNNGGPLNERARIRLACSIPKTEAAARKQGKVA